MGTLLMCKNNPVYDIDTDTVINREMLPGYMRVMSNDKNKFKHWIKLRYSSNTNSLARKLKGITFGQGNRVRINKETHALSLSDCYWIKQSEDRLLFEQISPYYTPFWSGAGCYQGQSIPTLYAPGYLDKYWENSNTLCKLGKETIIEYECSRLCKIVNIPVADVEILPNKLGIAVRNITSPDIMLEQADQSGMIDPDDFDNTDIIKHFGLAGFKMILIDAIVGNGDRHAGNFGWVRDANTGVYLGMAPLYDFDHALDSTCESDLLTSEAVDIAKDNREYKKAAISITKEILKHNINQVFRLRARYILNRLK